MTISTEEWKNRVGYHPASTKGVANAHEHLRTIIFEAGKDVLATTQPSREQSLAMTHLEEALMWSNKSVAVHESPLSEEWQDKENWI